MRFTFFFAFWICITFGSMGQSYQLGIVTDFEQSPVIDSLFEVFTNEINKTIAPARSLTLTVENIKYGASTFQDAGNYYKQITATSDVVILLGSISIKGSVAQGDFSLPTFGLGIVDPFLQNIPYDNGYSSIDNFSYIITSTGLEKELLRFKKVFPFNDITLLVNSGTDLTVVEARGIQLLNDIKQTVDAEVRILPLGNDLKATLSKLHKDTEAIYITDIGNLLPNDIREIANELIRMKIPSFSSTKWHLKNGIFAGVADEDELDQVKRKLAIMVDEALDGASLADMSVTIELKEDLYINETTANELNIALPFDILFTSKIERTNESLPTYSLEELIDIAFQNNFDIKISMQDVQLAAQDINTAKTSVLPTLDLSLNAAQINPESTSALFDQPERRMNGQLSLNQLIYSEKAIAGIKITQYLQKSQEYATEAEILQVMLNTYVDYFTVLSAKTNLEIEQENLDNLKTNLELAKLRVNVGSASQAEILRWESEVAAANQSVIQASTNLLASKLKLNTALANSLEWEFDIEDVTVDDRVYTNLKNDPISQFVDNPQDIQTIADFLVNEALENNPNKMFVLEQIKAAERQNVQNKRLLYTPDVAFQAQTTQVLYRGGQGSAEVPGMAGFIDNTWSIGVGVVYPIISGNARRVDLQTTRIQLEQLDNTRKQLDQNLELAVRTSILNTISSATNIEFSEISSSNALENYSLVQDNYREGAVSITQLIDAQQSALLAKQRYAVSIYDYIQSQLELEFSIGFFSMFAGSDDIEQFRNRFFDFRDNR